MTFTIDKRLLVILSLTFICMTIIGTLSHEFGHLIAAKLMGFEARINYMSTILTDKNRLMNDKQDFWFILGGPLQTVLSGSIGLLCLSAIPKNTQLLTKVQWGFIFLSLFWLRQSANFTVLLATWLITGNYSSQSDEINLSRYLHWPDWIIVSVTAFIGFMVLAIVIFRFIPKSQRFTFILSGVIGGISGYLLWLVYLGRFIMP